MKTINFFLPLLFCSLFLSSKTYAQDNGMIGTAGVERVEDMIKTIESTLYGDGNAHVRLKQSVELKFVMNDMKHHLRRMGKDGRISKEEFNELLAKWAKDAVPAAKAIIAYAPDNIHPSALEDAQKITEMFSPVP